MTANATTFQIHEALTEPFPREMIRQVNKSGSSLDYIPIAEVIARLNRALGVDNWSSQVIDVYRDRIDTNWVIAHVRLTAVINGVTVIKDGVGGQQIKMTKKDGLPVDLGDEFKGAVSDALKKATQQLGVGLHLARKEEALYYEAREAAEAAEANQPPADPAITDAFATLKELSSGLNADEKVALNAYWVQYSGGRSKPNPVTGPLADIEAMIAEVTRMTFGGDYVDDAPAA